MNALTQVKAGEIIEAVIARGDIANLTAEERARYYTKVCESVGLNPMTRPFEYITLNSKLTLYARKDATDQLRQIHKVSVIDLTESEREGVFVVTAKVQNGEGRTDIAKGAVNINGLKGEALANALMKAETKAKRRATLSICGLGFLDETEIEDIPAAAKAEPKRSTSVREMMRDDIKEMGGLSEQEMRELYMSLLGELKEAAPDELEQWAATNAERIRKLPMGWQGTLKRNIEKRRPTVVIEPPHDMETGEIINDTVRVVWEENGERPATVDDFGIPEALKRFTATEEATWFEFVQSAVASTKDRTSLVNLRVSALNPEVRRKVSTKVWGNANAAFEQRLQALS
jgi:hypothetical protein